MTAFRDLTKALKSLGLTDNAVSFYLTSYRLGVSTIGKVAEKANMDRSSAYLACKQLQEAGLMEEELSSGVTTILAKAPSAVLSRLRAETRQFRAQTENVEAVLPELMAEYAARSQKPVLQFFSGRAGFAQITEDVLEDSGKELLLFSNQQEERRVFSDVDHRDFIKARIARNIPIRVLTPDTPEAHTLQKADARCLRETRIIPDTHAFTSETYIYGNNVAMLSFNREIVGFIVRSADFAASQRWIFNELWEKYTPRIPSNRLGIQHRPGTRSRP